MAKSPLKALADANSGPTAVAAPAAEDKSAAAASAGTGDGADVSGSPAIATTPAAPEVLYDDPSQYVTDLAALNRRHHETSPLVTDYFGEQKRKAMAAINEIFGGYSK